MNSICKIPRVVVMSFPKGRNKSCQSLRQQRNHDCELMAGIVVSHVPNIAPPRFKVHPLVHVEVLKGRYWIKFRRHHLDVVQNCIGIVAGLATSSIPVPLKTRRVGQRCTLNLSRAEMSPVGVWWSLKEGVPAQVSPTSLDHG
ncbi:hypothetical protein TNCV_4132151 [Trichonephila clavipes]|nr:hypothetical protein TNCV_4132151 [Trichonephila clavipes]